MREFPSRSYRARNDEPCCSSKTLTAAAVFILGARDGNSMCMYLYVYEVGHFVSQKKKKSRACGNSWEGLLEQAKLSCIKFRSARTPRGAPHLREQSFDSLPGSIGVPGIGKFVELELRQQRQIFLVEQAHAAAAVKEVLE